MVLIPAEKLPLDKLEHLCYNGLSPNRLLPVRWLFPYQQVGFVKLISCTQIFSRTQKYVKSAGLTSFPLNKMLRPFLLYASKVILARKAGYVPGESHSYRFAFFAIRNIAFLDRLYNLYNSTQISVLICSSTPIHTPACLTASVQDVI